MAVLTKGSVKELHSTDDPDVIEFVFSDHISVFDKVIPTTIPNKGESLCRTAAHWFLRLEELGIKTHFIEYIPPNRMRVKRVDIIKDYSLLNSSTTNYLIPLEFICRYYLAGSMFDRIGKGKVTPAELGYSPGHSPVYGEELPKAFFEMTTKLEAVDTLLSHDEALDMAGISQAEFESIRDIVLRIDEDINAGVKDRGLIHVDGKKELAFDKERNLMLIDVFGTADEDRFWDMEAYSEGNHIELSKEVVRQHYRSTGYMEELYSARENGQPEPPMPALPGDFVAEVSKLYIDLFERITGKDFR